MNRFGSARPPAIAAVLLIVAAVEPRAEARDERLRFTASGAPSEVLTFLKRKGACDRLSDDDVDDPDRLAEVVRSRVRMKCELLHDEERRLRARYDNKPDVIELIERGDD